MIDHPEKTARLLAALKAATPFEVELVPSQFAGRELLTRRELEVLDQVALGVPNKAAARNLGISVRTVEVHRARIMDKLRARNAVDLMRIVLGRANNH